MNPRVGIARSCWNRSAVVALGLLCITSSARAGEASKLPANVHTAPVVNAQAKRINYSREELQNLESRSTTQGDRVAQTATAQGFVPSPADTTRPFWQFAIFGSGIGASNIVFGLPAVAGRGREVIIGGNSASHFGGDDFWHVIRRTEKTGNYDQVFVSNTYSATIKRIAVGNVVGDAQQEIAVMLADGRVYLYDLATKKELGYSGTGASGAEGLSLTDLDGDGRSELIVTTTNDLRVCSGSGDLLWEVPGAGGYDVVVGQMDTDASLEIAATNGTVVDAATRAGQWTRTGGFGADLELAPIPGGTYQQLIAAAAWYDVYAYDVGKELPRWSIRAQLDIGALAVADVNNDGTPEVIIGDGQWGSIHVYDLVTQARKWKTANPEHGVTNIAVGDVDNDGVVDLLWGAGWSSTGSDHFFVASTTGAHAIKWQSIDLQGPFVGPAIGDLDGDGQAELVFCSVQSDSGYSSGRILVFDLATLSLRAMSAPVVDNRAWTGVHDFKLRDVEGDGRMEIVLAADNLYNGVVEIYGFDSSNAFTLKWTNTTRPEGSPFYFVELADLDDDGTVEIIAANGVEHTGSEGVYVYIFDLDAPAKSWRSVNMAGGFRAATGLVVDDLDGNGTEEIAALVSTGDLYTFDGPTRELRSLVQATGGTALSNRRSASGLVLADSAGMAHFLKYANEDYTENFSRDLGEMFTGINVLADGALWVGTGGTLTLRVPLSYTTVTWQSPFFGSGFGRFVATDVRKGQRRVFSSARHAVAGFVYGSAGPNLLNISTRSAVQTGDNVLIGGFIIGGDEPKKVIVRGLGPSLPVDGKLADPTLVLNQGDTMIAVNDNWKSSQRDDIEATSIPPTHDLEAAIIRTLQPGQYTAVLRGQGSSTGVGLMEVFDLGQGTTSTMANISTRGSVATGDDVMIGGLILGGGAGQATVVVRAIGPSLKESGISDALDDPMLELRNADGATIQSNDDWRQSQQQSLIDSGVPPANDRESALITKLPPGNYTAIVRGKNNSSGVGLVEVYNLR